MISPVMPTYARTAHAFVKGEGAWLVDETGRRHLDFGAGIAVNCLGHAHPKLVAALTEQAGRLWHTSNLYRVPNQERLAKMLAENTFADTAFFTNSGAEAMELCIKLSRKYQSHIGQPEKTEIITFEGSTADVNATISGNANNTTVQLVGGTSNRNVFGFTPSATGFDGGEGDWGEEPLPEDPVEACLLEVEEGVRACIESGERPRRCERQGREAAEACFGGGL